MEARIARIESDVAHLLTDVADIKTDLRSLREKVDAKFDGVGKSIEQLRSELKGDIANLKDGVASDIAKLKDGVASDIATLKDSLASVRENVVAVKVWGLGLGFTIAAGVLGTLARALGWI